MSDFKIFVKWIKRFDDVDVNINGNVFFIKRKGLIGRKGASLSDPSKCILVIWSQESFIKIFKDKFEYHQVNLLTNEKVLVESRTIKGFYIRGKTAKLFVGSDEFWFRVQ